MKSIEIDVLVDSSGFSGVYSINTVNVLVDFSSIHSISSVDTTVSIHFLEYKW